MASKVLRLLKSIGDRRPTYHIFFVTARCNAKCPMCFYMDNMENSTGRQAELTLEEYEKISRGIPSINILGISGGEPFMRKDLAEIVKIFYRNCKPIVVDLPTNASYTENVVRQVEDMAANCPDLTIDVQLSLDGPQDVHDKIRGIPDGFDKVHETYRALLPVRARHPNLKLKACVVYSHYNQDRMEELFEVLHRDYAELDRIVFSVAHGSVWEEDSLDLDWARYFKLCGELEGSTRISTTDFHSVFTFALRQVKNHVLRKNLREGDFYRHCQAGQRVIVVGETGQVYPCEPLWESVGDLRENGYDLEGVLQSEEMRRFQEQIIEKKCNCHWGLPMSNNLLSSPGWYPRILASMAKVLARNILLSRN